jgi:hypothetical protein
MVSRRSTTEPHYRRRQLRCIIGPAPADDNDGRISGKTRPDAGTAFFSGGRFDAVDRAEIAQPESGKFQKPTVFERHSVFENPADENRQAGARRSAWERANLVKCQTLRYQCREHRHCADSVTGKSSVSRSACC